MLRKRKKRWLGLLLVLTILLSGNTGVLAGAVGIDRNSALTAAPSAQTASASASWIYISTQDLFRLYPECLYPDIDRDIQERFRIIYGDFVNDYAGDDTEDASYLYALQNGMHMIMQELTALFGWGQSVQEEISADALSILYNSLFTDYGVVSQAASSVSTYFTTVKKSYDLYKETERAMFISDIKKSSKHLSDEEIEKMADEMFGSFGKLLGYAADGIELYKMANAYFMLEEIQFESLMTLIQLTPEHSELRGQLVKLMETKRQTLLETFADEFLRDKFIGMVQKALLKQLAGAGSLSVLLSGLFIDFIAALYPGPKADEIAKLYLLYAYATDMESAVNTRRMYFWECKLQNKPVSGEDIDQFLFLHSAWLAVQRTILKYAIDLDGDYYQRAAMDMLVSVLYSYTGDKYLDMCKETVRGKIDSGEFNAPEAADGSEISNVSEEESFASIQEKFRQIQAQYPPNQGVKFNDSYGGCRGCYGFARLVFNKLFDCDMPSAYYNARRYEYVNANNVVLVGQLEGVSEVTAQNVKTLLSQAKLGDIIQACGSYNHTMVVVEADDAGIVLYDANSLGDNVICRTRRSYAEMAEIYGKAHESSATGMSLYRAANYGSLYWDGTAVFYDDSVNYVIKDGVLTAYNGSQRHLTIPYGVAEIADGVFRGKNISTVVFPEGLLRIGNEAFQDCSSLYYMDLNNDLQEIGQYAFDGCSMLAAVLLPPQVTVIEHGAFQYCTSLSEAVIPDSVTEIGDYAFYRCPSLTEITIPDGVTRISDFAFCGCFPVTEVIIPDSVTEIGDYAFGGCALTEVIIPHGVTEIGAFAFSGCSSLEKVQLSKNLEIIGRNAFSDTKLTSIEIPKSLKSGGLVFNNNIDYIYGAFSDLKTLKEVTFEKGTTRIADCLFEGCTGLEQIIIPDTVTSIGDSAFADCVNLKKVIIPDSVTEIGKNTFHGCTALTKVSIPDSITKIEYRVFSDCTSLTEMVIPESVTEIGSQAFYACTSLTEMVIPDSVTKIESSAFSWCTSLEKVQLSKELTELQTLAFSDSGITEIVVPEGVVTIGSSVFADCAKLTSAALPKTLRSLGPNAFSGCRLLETVYIPDYTVTAIPAQAFYECNALKSIVIPKGVTLIDYSAFANATALSSVEIPQSVTRIADNAFSYPQKTVISGCSGSYAETFAGEKGFAFVTIDNNPSYGLAPADGQYEIVLDRGERRRLQFFILPEDTTDIITLSSDNSNVEISGLELYARYSGDCTVTATTTSGLTCELNVHIRMPEQLIVKNPPAKTTYYIGEKFDMNGLLLELQYDDGTVQAVYDYTVSGFDNSREGICAVTLTFAHPFRTFKATLEVNIVDSTPKLESIEIGRLPDKQIYLRGERLDMSGAQIIGRFSDGSQKEITQYQISGYNALKTGKQTITISAEGKTASFTVEVVTQRIIGDANGDGSVDIRDLVRMKKLAASNDYTQSADLISDNRIDSLDLAEIRKYLLGILTHL